MNPRRLLRGALVALAPLSAFVAAALLLPWLLAQRPRAPVEEKLRDPHVAEAVARTLARYAQSDPNLFPRSLDYAWLPDELNIIRHGLAEITTQGARVNLGGGFHSFGYELRRDPAASDPRTNTWHLSLYREDTPPDPLVTVRLAATDRVTPGILLTNLTRAYLRQLSAFPADDRAHRGRIRTLLRFGEVARARQATRDMLAHLPEDGWVVLLHALIEAEERGLPAADRAMEEYVRRKPDFFRHLDLAYFHQLTERPGRAADAVRRAAACDANVTGGSGGDSELRGFTAAMYLYRSGQFEVTVALCDQLQGVWINGDYAKPALRALRAAANEARLGRITAFPWPAGVPPFQPFEDIDLARLLGRPTPGLRAALP